MSASTRRLGRSGIEVSALGVGTWAIGGPMSWDGEPVGYGRVDDAESVRALRRAFDLGVSLVDTADAYGTGHAEEVVARAVAGRRDDVVIATKWGHLLDPASRALTGSDGSPGYVRPALEASLRRLGTDRVELFQLHLGDLDPGAADDVAAACEDLVTAGLVRTWGWSTDDPVRVAGVAGHPHFGAVQHMHNVLHPASAMVRLCEQEGLTALARSPLAMGLLTARVEDGTRFAADDIRGSAAEWMPWFRDGRPSPDSLAARAAVREVLTSSGRTLAQGALAWLWSVSPCVVPIPGVRTLAQVEDDAGALGHGPLTDAERDEVERLLGRSVGQPAT